MSLVPVASPAVASESPGPGVPVVLERDRDTPGLAPLIKVMRIPVVVPVFGQRTTWRGGSYELGGEHLTTHRWVCLTCGVKSFCTFLTAEEAEHYGSLHDC